MLSRIRLGRFAHPCTLHVRIAPRLEALTIARAIAFDNLPELVPVDLSKIPVAGSLVEFQVRIRKLETDSLRLWHGEIDETLSQLVIRFSLHPPSHELGSIR